MTTHKLLGGQGKPGLQPDNIIRVEDQVKFATARQVTFHIRRTAKMKHRIPKWHHAFRKFFFYIVFFCCHCSLPCHKRIFRRVFKVSFPAISRSRAAPQKTGHKLRKVRVNDSAEYPARGYKLHDFPRRPCFASSTPQGCINFGQSRFAGPSDRCSFFGSFLCTLKGIKFSKEMNY
jgi:hypothetical protein